MMIGAYMESVGSSFAKASLIVPGRSPGMQNSSVVSSGRNTGFARFTNQHMTIH